MNEKILHITEHDRFRIQLLLTGLAANPRTHKLTASLRDELARSITVAERLPETAALESTVDVLDLDSGDSDRFTLTLPEQADATQGRLSILAPLGTALLGYSACESSACNNPRRPRSPANSTHSFNRSSLLS